MPRAAGDGLQRQGPAGDCLPMTSRFNEPGKNVPPIVKQRNKPRRQLATRNISRDEAATAPLVLRRAGNDAAAGTITIKLAETHKLVINRRNGNRIFADPSAGGDFYE